MKNLKLYNNLKTRFAALALAATMIGSTAVGLSGCKSEDENLTPETVQTLVDDTKTRIDTTLPEANDEIVDNATIMLLLDILAKKDENGKINSDIISNYVTNIDADDMISEFNSFLDIVEQKAVLEGEVEKLSFVLPDELNNDKIILANIETILENIIKYSKENNKDAVIKEFNKMYTLFVEEKEIKENGTKFEIRDLTYTSRAVANMYAETANYYSRNFISEEKYKNMDERTNDQNNKAYIKSTLEILDNQMEEKSEVDVITLFDEKYTEVSDLLNGKVKLSKNTIENLVNYMNLDYLNSDKVAKQDMNQIVGEYDDDKLSDVISGVNAINAYNIKNQNNMIPYSAFLVDEHLKTDTGKADKIALDFVQYNSIMFLNKNNEKSSDAEVYFENVYKYFTKQDFTHIDNKGVKNNILWQDISDGVNFVNYQIIFTAINKLPNSDVKDSYIAVAQQNFGQSIQYIQNTITGECKKVDVKEYVKTK